MHHASAFEVYSCSISARVFGKWVDQPKKQGLSQITSGARSKSIATMREASDEFLSTIINADADDVVVQPLGISAEPSKIIGTAHRSGSCTS